LRQAYSLLALKTISLRVAISTFLPTPKAKKRICFCILSRSLLNKKAAYIAEALLSAKPSVNKITTVFTELYLEIN
jgi:hypothetical protein